MRLALFELKVAAVYLLRNFRFSRCNKTQIPLQFNTGLGLLQAKEGIVLTVEKRQ